MNILITSVGTATSVNLIRYFTENGHTLFGTDINDYGYTAGSMLVKAFYKVPLAKDPLFVEKINEIISRESIDIVIPVNDVEVNVCAENAGSIKCQCIIPDISVIKVLADKYVCSQNMMKLGIPVPAILENDNTEVKRILRDRQGVGSKGIQILGKGEAAGDYDKNDKFIQSFVEGDEYTIDVLADKEGSPIYIVPRKRLEVKSGVATKARIVNDSKLIEYAKIILNNYKLPGFSNIQFFKDVNDNYWFIEVNYRFSGCGAATLATCKDYIQMFEKVVRGEAVDTELNHDTKWGAVVTRYYEEVVYEDSNN